MWIGISQNGVSSVTRLINREPVCKMFSLDMSGVHREYPMNSPELDDWLGLVTDWKRRGIIQLLRQSSDGKVTVDDIATELGNWVIHHDRDQLVNQDQLAIELIHHHLPKLADRDVISFDRERGTVQYQAIDQLETVLDALPERVPALRHE